MRHFAFNHNVPLDDQRSEKIDKIFPFFKFFGQCPWLALVIHFICNVIKKVESFCVRKFELEKFNLNLFECFDLEHRYSSEEGKVGKEVMRKKSIASQLPSKKIPVQNYPKQLMVQIRFHKVGTIDTKNQIFHATIEVITSWSIESDDKIGPLMELVGSHEKEKDLGFALSEEEMKQCEDFIPQLLITNLEDTKKERTVYSFSIHGSEIKFNMRWHLKGNFYEQMELYDFPFDVQDLCVRIDLGERSKDKFYLQAEEIPGILNDKSFQDEQEWDIFKMVQTGENNAQAEEDSEPDGVLVLRCNVKRKFNYFLYNCFLVMLFFAVMSMCNFANKPENVQFRLAGTLTLVLTSVAYKLMLSNSLPTISYLTLVDVYVLFSVFMLTFLVVAFAVLHTVYRHFNCCLEPEELTHLAFRLDIMTMAVLAAIHILWNLSFGLYAFHKTRQVTDKLREDETAYAEKLAKHKPKKEPVASSVTIDIPSELPLDTRPDKTPTKSVGQNKYNTTINNSNDNSRSGSIINTTNKTERTNSINATKSNERDRERDRERDGYRKLVTQDNALSTNSPMHRDRGERGDLSSNHQSDRERERDRDRGDRDPRDRDRDRDRGRDRDRDRGDINPPQYSSNSSPHTGMGGRSSQQHQSGGGPNRQGSFRNYPPSRSSDKNSSVAIDLRGHSSSEKRKKATFVSV